MRVCVIGCFYFTIGNVHPKFRSSLKSIQLVALAKNEHLKKYGMNNILQCIVNDVAKLEKVAKMHVRDGLLDVVLLVYRVLEWRRMGVI